MQDSDMITLLTSMQNIDVREGIISSYPLDTLDYVEELRRTITATGVHSKQLIERETDLQAVIFDQQREIDTLYGIIKNQTKTLRRLTRKPRRYLSNPDDIRDAIKRYKRVTGE